MWESNTLFEVLAGAIEAMEPPSHNATLAEALALRDRFDARLAIGVNAFPITTSDGQRWTTSPQGAVPLALALAIAR